MLTRRRNSVLPKRYGAILVGALVVLLSPVSNAETRLTGQIDAVRMEARDASIEDVLTALGAAYGLRFRTVTPLGAHITRTFTGPLPKVVAQVLEGYDFVSKSTNGAVEVTVVGVVGDRQAVPSPEAVPAFATLLTPPASPSTPPPGVAVPAVPPALFDWEMPKNADQSGQSSFATLPPPPTTPSTPPPGVAVPAVPPAIFDWEMPANVAHPR